MLEFACQSFDNAKEWRKDFGLDESPLVPWCNKESCPILVRVDAYTNSANLSTSTAVDDLFALHPVARPLWALREWLGVGFFGSVRDTIADKDRIPHGVEHEKWQEWRKNIDTLVEGLRSAEGQKVVLCGRAPLALWMYVGRVLADRNITVINVPLNVAHSHQVFPLNVKVASEIQTRDLFRIDVEGTADGGHVVFITPDPKYQFSGSVVNKKLSKVVIGEPNRPRHTFTPADVPKARVELARLFDECAKDKVPLFISTTAVDGLAVLIGQVLNPNKYKVTLMDQVAGKSRCVICL